MDIEIDNEIPVEEESLTEISINRILDNIKTLHPQSAIKYTDEQLIMYIDIVKSVALADTAWMNAEMSIEDAVKNQELAIALLVLDYLFTSEFGASASRKKVRDVEISFYDASSGTRWKQLYKVLVNNTLNDQSLELHYVGIR